MKFAPMAGFLVPAGARHVGCYSSLESATDHARWFTDDIAAGRAVAFISSTTLKQDADFWTCVVVEDVIWLPSGRKANVI